MKKTTLAVIVLIIASFLVGIYTYPEMPDKVASHWNSRGEVDGYMSKFWGIFLMPIISLGVLLLFLLIPKIDPLKKNIKKFRNYFDWFILLIVLFLFYIYLLTVFWNLGYSFNMTTMMLPALGILFYYVGILTENAKRNWFIGIRTPWTLSSETVWDKTHKIGGKLFKAAGALAFVGIFFQEHAVKIVIIPVIAVAVFLLVYSYFEYQKLQKNSRKKR